MSEESATAGKPRKHGIDVSDRLGLALVCVVLLGVAARAVVLVPRLGEVPGDPDNYLPLARSIADGQGLSFQGRPTAYRPPLYPLILAPLVKLLGTGRELTWGVGLLHIILGIATIGMCHAAAIEFGLSGPRALLAAFLVAIDPVLVVQSGSVMTETLAAALLAAALAALAWNRRTAPILAGVAFGLTGLCRPSTLSAASLTVFAALAFGPGGFQVRLSRASLLGFVILLTLLPWVVRNQALLGAPIWTTTHGGYTLYLANNAEYYADVLNGPPGAVWSGANQRRWFERVNQEARGMPEPQADRLWRRRALEFIAGHPWQFARAAVARMSRFWGVSPAEPVYASPLRILTAVWTIPFWVLVVLGALRPVSWRWPMVASVCVVLGLAAVHLVFWTDLRMRAPIVPALALLAAHAFIPNNPVESRPPMSRPE